MKCLASNKNLLKEIRETERKMATDFTIKYMTVSAVMTLADKFGFDKEQLQAFLACFAEKFDCVKKDYVTFEDYERVIRDEYDIVIS